MAGTGVEHPPALLAPVCLPCRPARDGAGLGRACCEQGICRGGGALAGGPVCLSWNPNRGGASTHPRMGFLFHSHLQFPTPHVNRCYSFYTPEILQLISAHSQREKFAPFIDYLYLSILSKTGFGIVIFRGGL